MYTMPVSIGTESNHNSIAKLSVGDSKLFLLDGSDDPLLANHLLELLTRRKKLPAEDGSLVGQNNRWFRQAISRANGSLEPRIEPSAERNTTIRFGQQFVLKLLRATEPGLNPAVELGRLLSEHYNAKHVAPFGGTIEYEQNGTSSTIGVLHGFVPHEGDAWALALNSLNAFYDRGRHVDNDTRVALEKSVPANVFNLKAALAPAPEHIQELLGSFLTQATLLGKQLAELHAVLGKDNLDARIAPESYNDFYRQSLYHGMLRLLSRQFEFLRRHYSELPDDVREFASQILEKEDTLGARFRTLYELRIEAVRIRYHGQMVLEHVLPVAEISRSSTLKGTLQYT